MQLYEGHKTLALQLVLLTLSVLLASLPAASVQALVRVQVAALHTTEDTNNVGREISSSAAQLNHIETRRYVQRSQNNHADVAHRALCTA